MDTDTWEIAWHEELVQLDRTGHRLYENNNLIRNISKPYKKPQITKKVYLVKLKRVEEFIQLPILANLLQFDEVLL